MKAFRIFPTAAFILLACSSSYSQSMARHIRGTLKVDIIAYQDEIGCVVDLMPFLKQ